MKAKTNVILNTIVMLSMLVGLIVTPALASSPAQKAAAPETQAVTQQAQNGITMDVSAPVTPKISKAVRDLPVVPVKQPPQAEINQPRGIPETRGTDKNIQDPLAANGLNSGHTPDPDFTFEGIGDLGMYTPPDTTGDVGPNHFVQMVNVKFAIYDKTGSLQYGPVDINSLWDGFGGPCENENDGDPIVLYDDMADRWMMTQFAINTTPQLQCMAVSTTPDPSGTYYLYAFSMPDFPDYPKFGVWPDGYYFGTNTGYPNQYYAHVVDRNSMLIGAPAVRISFGGYANFLMPADADGQMPPPEGSPEYFYTYYSEGYPDHPAGVDRLAIYEFVPNWANPGSSTFDLVNELPIAPFNYTVCGFFGPYCIDEPSPGVGLDSLSWWPMVRLQYRNLGAYEAMVSNFTVDVDGSDTAGIRWFELRKNGANPWALEQEGTFAPDGSHRWMGSAAMDGSGNIALGYSVSDATVTKPSIRYTVHQTSDPPGTMQAEASIMEGQGVNTGPYGRWGDYSAMNVDPVDQCTFWYTNEYHDVVEDSFMWNTHVGVFRVPTCSGSIGPTGTLNGNVTDLDTGDPIEDAHIAAQLTVTQTFGTSTDQYGDYSMTIPVGTYDVTASAFGYLPETEPDVDIISGTVTTQDFALAPAESSLIYGYIRDANTGWPLYASFSIDGVPGGPFFNDPVTGYYEITLPDGAAYDFTIDAWVGGYETLETTVGPFTSDTEVDFDLEADMLACDAPGYTFNYDWFENFEGGDGGFTISGYTTWQWGVPTSGPGEAHSGQNVWATNLSGNYNTSEDGYITSPLIDLSGFPGASFVVDWYQWAQTESSYDYISVEASNNGGASWNVVYGPLSGPIDATWAKKTIVLPSSYAVSNAQLRFHFTSDSSVVYPGWYVDDIGIAASYPPPPTSVYLANFNANDGGYTHAGTFDEWQWGVPTTAFPGGCNGGSAGCWDTDLAANYENNSNYSLYSPVIDLSGVTLPPGASLYVNWAQALHIESSSFDHANANASINGGAYTNLWAHSGSTITSPWAPRGPFDISSAAGGSLQLQFQLTSDSSVNYEGWSIDDVEVYYATPWTPSVECVAPSGGLVVGNVYDANTGSDLTGALVQNEEGYTFVASPTADPAVGDAFYTLYASDDQDFTASFSSNYTPDTEFVDVVPGGTVGQDFYLDAGWLTYEPPYLHVTLPLGATDTQALTLTNQGAVPVTWELLELDKGVVPLGNIESPDYGVVRPRRQQYKTSQDITPPRPIPDAQPWAAGDVVQSWPAQQGAPWGIAYDSDDSTVWVGEGWGSSQIFEYGTDGTPTGRVYDFSWGPLYGPADTTYNWNTGMLWSLDVGLDNCIHEIDPASGVTGMTICPAFSISQRGLAYDPGTDTYFAGGWNDAMVYRFDSSGTILEAVNTGLSISGLAFNADTQHLFVMVNSDPNPVYVLDVADNYNVIGQFNVSQGFAAYGGAGLEFDCEGNLWGVDQGTGTVYQFESGETTSMCAMDVPWLSESPISGTLPAGGLSAETVLGNGTPVYRGAANSQGSASRPVTLSLEAAGSSASTAPAPAAPAGAVDLVLDDGSIENNIGIGGGWEFIFVNRFTPDPGDFPFDLNQVQVYFEGGTTGVAVDDPIQIVVYENTSGNTDPAVGSNLLASYSTTVQAVDEWNVYDLATPVRFNGPGDVIIGVIAMETGVSPYYPAAMDQTASQERSWAGWWLTSPPPEPPVLPPDDTWGLIDSFGTQFAGNWMIRGYGETPPSFQVVDVTFDASVVSQPGNYLAQLKIKNDTPYPVPNVPITMTVIPTDDYGKLEGTVTSLGYCDVNPAPAEGATVVITSGTDVYTTTTDADGYYQYYLLEAGNPYIVTVTAENHESGSAEVSVSSDAPVTQDFDLRLLEPCVSAEPGLFDVEVGQGYSLFRTLDLMNDGAEGTDFALREQDKGFVPAVFTAEQANFSIEGKTGPASVLSPEGKAAMAQVYAPNAWTPASPIPVGLVRYAHAQCAETPDSFYLISGVSNGSIIANTYRYDADTDTWTDLAPIPAGQEGPTAACYEGYIFVMGGGGTNQFYIYDIANDTWAPGPALPRGLEMGQAGAYDGKIFLLSGDDDFYPASGISTAVDIYDIAAGTWSSGTDMPEGISNGGYYQVNEFVYIVGGWNESSPGVNSDQTYRYDMANDVWEVGPTFTSATADQAVAASKDGIYSMGGDANGGAYFDATTTVDVYDYPSWPGGSWADAGDPLPAARTANNAGFCTTAAAGGEVWSDGGLDASFTWYNDNWYMVTGSCAGGSSDVWWLEEEPVTGTLPADSSATIDVTFVTTPTTPLGVYNAILTVKTDDPLNGTIKIPVTMTVAAPAFGVDVGADQALSGRPGETVTYEVTVTNASNGPEDTFDITVSGNGWTTTAPATVGPLAAGASETIDVTVEIPASAVPGDTDAAVVTATSQGDGAVSDSATLTTTVIGDYALEMTPAEDAQVGMSGDVVVYTVTCTNVADPNEVTISVSGNAWDVQLSADSASLGTGESVEITVSVTIPAGAGGESDTVTVTATGLGGSTASTVLTTTAQSGMIYLPVVMNGYNAP